MKNVVLAFVAHPDDAEFFCAGTLIRLAELGWEVHIATATPGDCGTMVHTRWDIASIRTREASKAAGLIGATYHCLDERDGMVVFDRPALVKTLDLFRRVTPQLVITHPIRDYMMDHEQVSQLVRAASFVYGAPNVSQVPRQPHAAVPHVYFTDPVEGIDDHGRPAEIGTLVDISKQFKLKTKMLACHASQREWLRAHHGIDEYLDAMKRLSAARGRDLGVKYAENFVQYRPHSYPADDLLAKLFGKEKK
ncbi:MAG: PIG-L deacetylase family protein [Tepidisphaerales bacterium]